MRFVRLILILLLLGVMAVAVPAALQARGVQVSLPALPAGLSSLFGPDLESVPSTIAPIAATDSPTARPFRQDSRSDLTSYASDYEYAPDPTQGTFHRSDAGVAWWGAGPAEGDPRPVVFLLHGAGRDGRSMIDMWYEVAKDQGLVLIAPDFARVPGWDTGIPDPRVVTAALDHAETLYPVDRTRVTLFGHSRGAIAAQIWANRYAGPWRAVAAHAGTLEARFVQPVENGVPIRHYLGSVDQTFPFAPARDSGAALAAGGHPFELIRLEGHTHWLYDSGEDIAADAWTWLGQQID